MILSCFIALIILNFYYLSTHVFYNFFLNVICQLWNTHINNTTLIRFKRPHIEDLYPYQQTVFDTGLYFNGLSLLYGAFSSQEWNLELLKELELEMFIVACIVTNSWSYQYIKYMLLFIILVPETRHTYHL